MFKKKCPTTRGGTKFVPLVGVALFCALAHAAGSSIVVGQSLNLGPDSDGGGLRIEAATKGYFDSINNAGGIHGRRVELVSLNDDGDPAQHAKNLKILAESRGAVAFLNCEDDVTCPTSAATATALHVPLVGVISGLKEAPRTDASWVFRVRPDYGREASLLGQQLLAMACSRVAIVADAPDTELVDALRSNFAREGITATLVTTAPNAAAAAATIKALDKGMYHAAVIAVNLRTIEWLMDNQVTTRPEWPRVIAAMSSNHLQTLLAAFKAESFGFTYVVPNPEILDRPLTQEFQRTMDKFGAGHSSTYLGMEAYVDAKVLVEALRRAPKVEPRAVAETLRDMGNVDLGGFNVSFANGTGSGSSWVDIGVRSRFGQLLH